MIRYDGKPFLLLLDSYVLDAIGALDAADEATLAKPAEEVRASYGLTGEWRGLVAQQMQFPDGMAGAIREVWEKGAAKFRDAQGYDPNPGEFARQFVDNNFPR